MVTWAVIYSMLAICSNVYLRQILLLLRYYYFCKVEMYTFFNNLNWSAQWGIYMYLLEWAQLFIQLLMESIFTMWQNVKEEKKQQASYSGGKSIQT